jgi:hypothetical protein
MPSTLDINFRNHPSAPCPHACFAGYAHHTLCHDAGILTLSRPVLTLSANARDTSTSISAHNTLTPANPPAASLGSSVAFGVTKAVRTKTP